MEMTKREYAEVIAKAIGENTEVVIKSNANGVEITGIKVKIEGVNVAPTFYVDGYYEANVQVEEAARKLKELADKHIESIKANGKMEMEWVLDYENVKDKLTARLYNEATDAEVFRSAKKYGFDDLIIVPYINVNVKGIDGAIKVTDKLLEQWGVTKTKVINQALKNSANEARIEDLDEMIARMEGRDIEEVKVAMGVMGTPRMVIINNDSLMFGAVAVIAKLDFLKEKYGSFYVIPSSVHEVIVVPSDIIPESEINNMISAVNGEMISPEERLGSKAYFITA